MSETQLTHQLLVNNQKAIKAFYRQNRQYLLNFILTKVEAQEDAEEILQDSFLSFLDSLPAFKKNCSLFTYLCSIAKHEIADFYRKKKIKTFLFSHFPGLENLASQALDPETALEEVELKKEVLQTFQHLSEGYGRILRLKYIDHLSYDQISQILKKSAKAVESKLSRARLAFVAAWPKRLNTPRIFPPSR